MYRTCYALSVTPELRVGRIQIWHPYKCTDRQVLPEGATGRCDRLSRVHVVDSTYIVCYRSLHPPQYGALCKQEAEDRPSSVHGIHAQRAMSRRGPVPLSARELHRSLPCAYKAADSAGRGGTLLHLACCQQ